MLLRSVLFYLRVAVPTTPSMFAVVQNMFAVVQNMFAVVQNMFAAVQNMLKAATFTVAVIAHMAAGGTRGAAFFVAQHAFCRKTYANGVN